MRLFVRFKISKSGQGMVEYALALALIAIVVVATLSQVGGSTRTKYGQINQELESAVPGDGGGE